MILFKARVERYDRYFTVEVYFTAYGLGLEKSASIM
jgi:hypothetical protein